MSATSKSPRRVLKTAYAMAHGALPAYSHRFSPKKFTQHQLLACLVLKEFLKTDYRGLVNFLADCPSLRAAIDLEHVPHFTTVQKAADLVPGRTALSEILSIRPELSETAARSLLGSFLFSGDDVFKNTESLSGGEQSRVRLLKLILQSPDVLILDEPTNHLDIASREALEEALSQFPGTIIAVSHDRYFLDRMALRLLVMRPEACKVYNGNYSIYIEQVERERAEADQAAKAARRKQTAKKKSAKPRDPAQDRFRKLSLDKLEALIIEREEQIVALNARFADQAVYKDPQEVARLREEFDRLKTDLAAAETAWDRRASG